MKSLTKIRTEIKKELKRISKMVDLGEREYTFYRSTTDFSNEYTEKELKLMFKYYIEFDKNISNFIATSIMIKNK